MQTLPSCLRIRLALLASILLAASAHAAEPVSFRNEVMGVLSRSGCNSGACHGNLNGKNGFKLSLRGEDPAFDLIALTRNMDARRVNTHAPATSLLLTKATGVVPHEGGKRFAVSSAEYGILQRWIAEGAKDDAAHALRVRKLIVPDEHILIAPRREVKITVEAEFSDGRRRDVTHLTVFEPSNPIVSIRPDGTVEGTRDGETTVVVRYLHLQAPVRLAFVPERPDFVWKAPATVNFIDEAIDDKLKRLRINPSELCDDTTFVRRAYLDTLGRVPTAEEAGRFLRSRESTKRDRLIDALLEDSEFADFWALKWSDLLRNEEKTLDKKGVRLFHEWIRRAFVENRALNEFARELVSAQGSTYSHPAANYYRALRDPYTRAEATAQVFLGIRLQCARCHNHPFDQWTQNDYHSLAAFFPRINYRIIENNRKDRLDKHEFDGDQIVWQARSGELMHPVSGEPLAPRLLGTKTPKLAEEADRLELLAEWIADPKNPFFARAQANRIWYHLMGRGLVEPNDDFRASNPAVNGPLLDALTRELREHRFDLRHLVRVIMQSRTYQASAVPNDSNEDDESNFSHVIPRPIQAEALLDSMTQVIGVESNYEGQRPGVRAIQVPGVQSRRKGKPESERFLSLFGKPTRSLNCECERSAETTLNQALNLLTGPLLHEMLTDEDNRLGRLLDAEKSNAEIVTELYRAALSRPPSERESKRALELIALSKDRRGGFEDLLWALVNSKEFLLRR